MLKFVPFAVLGDEFIEISRKRGYETLLQIRADDILAEDQPTKFVLEVTTGTQTKITLRLFCKFSLTNSQFFVL